MILFMKFEIFCIFKLFSFLEVGYYTYCYIYIISMHIFEKDCTKGKKDWWKSFIKIFLYRANEIISEVAKENWQTTLYATFHRASEVETTALWLPIRRNPVPRFIELLWGSSLLTESLTCDLRAVIDWLLVPIRTRSWNAFTRSYVYFIYIFSSCVCSSVHTTFVVITFKYPLLFLHRDRILSLLFYLYQYRYCSSLSLPECISSKFIGVSIADDGTVRR